MTVHHAPVVLLALALVAPGLPQTGTTPRPAAQAARPGTLVLTVAAESGAPVSGALVSLRGAVDRGGTTGADGVVTLQNIPAGTYRARIARDGFITLEKEVTIRAGAKLAAEGVLSAAPPPPPPPPPPPAPVMEPKPAPAVTGPIGAPRALSIPDLFDQLQRDPQPTAEREIGCSVATSSRVILARETIATHRHADADEMLYVVAGEATLTIGDKDQNIGPGWLAVIPRGTQHSIARRGRNAPLLLSVRSGPPCPGL